MPILTLQQAARELGRIRLGEFRTEGGKGRPAKLERFRLTSPSRPLLEQVAQRYGGTVAAWNPQGGGDAQWEVYTDADRIPVLVPPDPVSQWFELWSGGGCLRRCDGQRETLSDQSCACDPDPTQRQCKPTTRLNVVLRDVPGIGVWRLETHGYYAAIELPALAGFLAATRGYVSAYLTLTERVVKREGQKPKRFVVPAIEVEDVTPAQLFAGGGGLALGLGNVDTTPATRAIEAAQGEDFGGYGEQTYIDSAAAAGSLEDLTALLAAAQSDGFARNLGDDTDPVVGAFTRARARLTTPAPTHPPARDDVDNPALNVDNLWMQVLAAAPEGWTADDVRDGFATFHDGKSVATASGEDMAAYLAHLRTPLAVTS